MTKPKVGVVGLGIMGRGIVEACARAGLDVVAIERDRHELEKGIQLVEAAVDRSVARGDSGHDEARLVLSRVRSSVDYSELFDRDLVIEAATEDEQAKLRIFTRLDDVVGTSTILASNTSSIPIARLALATKRPELVIGMHFFNPVPVQKLIEITPSLMTSAETRSRAEVFARETLGRRAIIAPDRAGFIVNALLIPYLLSAVRMLEGGHATRDDIDVGMVQGCAHPMGPLALIDLIGLDTVRSIAGVLFAEFGEPHLVAPPLLTRMVEAGWVGRKSGRGFHEYS